MKKIIIKSEKYGMTVDTKPYLAYLAEVGGTFPSPVRNYLEGIVNGTSHQFDVHDAAVSSLVIREVEEDMGEGNVLISTDAQLTLAHHNMDICIKYTTVYAFSSVMDSLDPPSTSSCYSDVLIEEITLTPEGYIRHELLCNNGTMTFICKGFDYTVTPCEPRTKNKCYSSIALQNIFPADMVIPEPE